MRVDLYTFIHKAQRFHLFKLSEKIGMTDFTISSDANGIAQEALVLLEHLKDHAQNEKTYIHPLFQEIGAVGEHFDNEHNNLELEIQKIENILYENRYSDLYSAYARFLGIYLLHLDEEEAAQRDILWIKYQDKDLADVFMRFKTERPAHLANADFVFMLPSLSVPELTLMFRGMKESAPEVVFQGACDTAAKILEPNKWQKIFNALAS